MILQVKIRKQTREGLLDAAFSITEHDRQNLSILAEPGELRTGLLTCIAGMEKPDEGSVILNDRVLSDTLKGTFVKPEERHVGLICRQTVLFSGLTVQDNVRLVLTAAEKAGLSLASSGNPVERLLPDLLHDFGLDGLGGKMPSELTASQRVRALFARMMASQPQLVLLDDPVSGLDGETRASILCAARDLCRKKQIPVIYAGANADEAYQMGDRILVLENGKTGESKEKNAFFEKPKTLTGALMSGVSNVARAVPLSKTHALVSDWGLVVMKRGENGRLLPLPEGLCAVGIRSSDLAFEKPEGSSVRLSVYGAEVEESPSCFLLRFCPVEGREKKIEVKVPKSVMRREELLRISTVYVPSNALLYLTDGALSC